MQAQPHQHRAGFRTKSQEAIWNSFTSPKGGGQDARSNPTEISGQDSAIMAGW